MKGNKVRRIYDKLFRQYGPQRWWPAKSPYEVCVGAILTQSTNWVNVEKSIENLKRQNLLDNLALLGVGEGALAETIRSTGYYNAKAKKLKLFAHFLDQKYDGDLCNMSGVKTKDLRSQLLDVWGIGPETADSILLYALGRACFVVDSYTRRVFSRIGLVNAGISYDELKGIFESSLPKRPRLYNEYHALIVEHCKRACRVKPLCPKCCLKSICGKKI